MPAHASGGGAVGGGAVGADNTRCSSCGSLARRMITPRSSDAAVRFLKLCFKKSKRAPTAASGSVAVTCTCSVALGLV